MGVMEMSDYFNTTFENGNTLVKSVRKCLDQESKILRFMNITPNECFSPSELFRLINWNGNTPLTSVRRAISNLTRKGFLYKTNSQVIGLYGKREFKWGVRSE